MASRREEALKRVQTGRGLEGALLRQLAADILLEENLMETVVLDIAKSGIAEDKDKLAAVRLLADLSGASKPSTTTNITVQGVIVLPALQTDRGTEIVPFTEQTLLDGVAGLLPRESLPAEVTDEAETP